MILLKDHEGRIFNTAGDSILAEFSSPVKAVECAVKIQNINEAKNRECAEQRRMHFRMGINIGDVMVSNNNLYGDAVNIAARLEASAAIDGVCISKNTYEMVNMKVRVSYKDASELELKNRGRPMKAYRITPCKGVTRYFVSSGEKPKIKVERAEPGSLVVMLFKNLSQDKEQGYFVKDFLKI